MSFWLIVGRVSQCLVHRLLRDAQMQLSESLILWIHMQNFVCIYKHLLFGVRERIYFSLHFCFIYLCIYLFSLLSF